MTLFTLLRFITDTTPIAIFDIAGKLISKVRSKQDINTDLLDYNILRIAAASPDDIYDNKCYVCICIQK